MNIEKGNKLLSIREAAELLGLSFWTLYGYVSQKRIPSYKIGRRRLISTRDLQVLIERSRCEANRDLKIWETNVEALKRG